MKVSTYSEETYPGQIRLLTGVVGQVRTIAQHGTIEDIRTALQEFDQEERAAWGSLPWAPTVGELYLVKGTHGAPDRAARVITDGVWHERVKSAPGYGLNRTYTRSSIRHENDVTGPTSLARTGRLVLETSGGLIMDRADEVNALRTFPLIAIPLWPKSARRALRDISDSGKTAGLSLAVRPCRELGKLPDSPAPGVAPCTEETPQ